MASTYTTITGVILAGGKSRRMGRNKALLPIDGRPIVDRIISLFSGYFATVMVVGGEAENFARYPVIHHGDIYPGSALGGLYTGLYLAETPYIFVSSCDIPSPSAAVMEHLIASAADSDAVVATTGHGPEPLFALYGKGCLERMHRQLQAGNFCIYDLYPHLDTRYVPAAELATLAGAENAFCNVNTPEDLRRFLEQKTGQPASPPQRCPTRTEDEQ